MTNSDTYKAGIYNVTAKTLTPVHIGSGDVYSQLDYVYHVGKIHILDFGRIVGDTNLSIINDLSREIKENFNNNVWAGDVAEFLSKYNVDWRNYVTRQIASEQIGRNELRQAVASGGKPFIPGSSIKGSLRTALLWHYIKSNDRYLSLLNTNAGSLNRRQEKSADDEIQKQLFGETPHSDIFRNLQVSDSVSIDFSKLKVIKLLSYNFLKAKRTGSVRSIPQFVEAIRENTEVKTQLRVVENERFNLQELFDATNEFSKSIIDSELNDFGSKSEMMNEVKQQIEGTKNLECVMKVGKGSGFFGLTVSSLLKPEVFMKVRRELRIGKTRNPRNPFPTSFPLTRIVYAGNNDNPISTLGWIKLSVEQQ